MARVIKSTIVEQLAAAAFVVTSDSQVEALARMNLDAEQTQDNVRGVYLKVLVAGVQRETKPVGRRKAGNAATALEKVHERFYAAVLKAVTTPDVADDPTLDRESKTLRGLERNRRSNFARTAHSVLKSFLSAGGDVLELDATKVTKNELRAFTSSVTSAPAGVEELEHKTTLAVNRVEEVARQLADSDKDAAVQVVEEAMAKLANLLAEFGRDPTKSTVIAIREHRPLRLDEGTFWPMARTSVPQGKESVQ